MKVTADPIAVFSKFCVRWLPIILALLGVPAFLYGAEPTRGIVRSRSWAVFVGVDSFEGAGPKRFAVNNVRQVSETLRKYGDIPSVFTIEMIDSGVKSADLPTKANIERELPALFGRIAAGDRLVFYWSGHGLQDSAGKLYVAANGSKASDPATAISVDWLSEQLAKCAAKSKTLLLDIAVTPGTEAQWEKSLATIETSSVIHSLRDSGIHADRRLSNFADRSIEGVRGRADQDGDHAINGAEWRNYVTGSKDASKNDPEAIVVRLRALTMTEALDRGSELFAQALTAAPGKAAVLQFASDSAATRDDYRMLGLWAAQKLAQNLFGLGSGRWAIVDEAAVQAALRTNPGDLRTLRQNAELRKRLAAAAGKAQRLAVSSFGKRDGEYIELSSELLDVESGASLARLNCKVRLNDSELAMLGRSFDFVKTSAKPSIPTTIAVAASEPQSSPIAKLFKEDAAVANPLLDPNYSFPVKVNVSGKQRDGAISGNDYLIPLAKGEKFAIEVGNNSDQRVLLRLLVDGLNTLPEPDEAGSKLMTAGKRVNLDEARPWVLEPKQSYEIAGFVTDTGAGGAIREFIVVDAAESLAAMRQTTDRLGWITAAFYAPRTATRGIGVGLGSRRQQDLTESDAVDTGELLSVIHLRYVDPKAIDAVQSR